MSDFDIHPVKKDLARLVDAAAVKRSLRNLLFTQKGSRFFNFNLGSGIQHQLFELMSPVTAVALKNEIELTINNFEPRVSLIQTDVIPDYNNNAYQVDIYFYLLNKSDPVSLSVTLERVI
jgi:phage baseplate assembly protein W